MSRGRPGFFSDPAIDIRKLKPEARQAFSEMGDKIRAGGDKTTLMRAFLKEHGSRTQQRAFETEIKQKGVLV